ncbi:hypothetical protein GPECTOR_9g663 [Gonium pectorale]|uniref:Uncharacterized protein n=1 Tax=Gonium pectorale TaxID=33097 RepID=A0A150GSF5_GONPE|nr:hypothetical protein GPECTOR_9g663 [Gonium pectorale]|eukprot:KXZ52618.1 hypothetical protein GPECTOR_9g663 [Gonium pectorale]
MRLVWSTCIACRLVHDPDPAEIQQLQAFYLQVHSLDERVPAFPPAYPKGVLLGSVEVVDVLPSGALEEWPGLPASLRLEATSPFCFLCEKPRRLVVPQQLKGDHKLWQLPRAVAKVALRGLRDPPGLSPFSWREFGDPRAMLAPAPKAHGRGSDVAGGGHGGERVGDGAGGRAGGGVAGSTAASAATAAGTDEGGDKAGGRGAAADGELVDVVKRERAVRKKLQQVSELEERQRSGRPLDPDQLAKLGRAEEWRRELRALQEAGTRAGGAVGSAQ